MSGEPYEWKGYQQTVSIPIPRSDQAFAYPPDKRHRWQHIANTKAGDHTFRCASCGKTWVVQSMANLINWRMRQVRAQTARRLTEQLLGPKLRRRP